MPATQVLFYQEEDARSPVVQWLAELRGSDPNAFANCLARVRLLAQLGHELRRPAADFLREGVHELRAKRGRVQYRILYFFHGRNIAVLAHAIVKKGSAVPEVDIERALHRKRRFEKDPAAHTFRGEVTDG
jgi:phage-related protein